MTGKQEGDAVRHTIGRAAQRIATGVAEVAAWVLIAALLALMFGARAARAQSLPGLTRSTSTTGLNDSALTLISDSARRTRAGTVLQVRKALSTHAFDSLLTATRLIGVDSAWTIGKSATAQRPRQIWVVDTVSARVFFGALSGTADSAVAAGRATKLTTARTLWGASFDGTGNVTAAPTFTAGATVSNGQTFALGSSTVSGTPSWSSNQAITLSTASQTNITNVGTLQNLNTSGNLALQTGFSITDGIGGSVRYYTDVNGPIIRGGASKGVILQSSSGLVSNAQFRDAGGVTLAAGRDSLLAGSALVFAANDTVYGGPVWNAGQTFGGTLFTIRSTQSGSSTSGDIVIPGANALRFGHPTVGTNATYNYAGLVSNVVQLGDASWETKVNAASVITMGGQIQVPLGATGGMRQTGGNNTAVVFGAGTGDTISSLIAASVVQRINAGGVDQFFRTRISGLGSASAPLYSMQPNLTGNQAGVYLMSTADTLAFSTAGTARFRIAASSLSPTSDNTRSLGDTAFRYTTAWLNPATEGSSQNALCVTAGGQVQQNSTTTCLVSAARYKTDIQDLSYARASHIVTGLRARTYTERVGGKRGLHVIAEQADSVDRDLAARDAKGAIQSVHDEAILTALLVVVQRQGARLAAMCKAGVKAACDN